MQSGKPELADKILDSALDLGMKESWDQVRLADIAKILDVSLGDVNACYSQKDDLVEAFFDRADHMLLAGPTIIDATLPTRDRLHQVIFAWLDALAEHRNLVPQMLGYKMEPLHIHLQAQGVLRISRTVQWFMEAAGIKTPNPRRAIEEFGLTAIYLATFLCWMKDASENQVRSREFLRKRLEFASKFASE